MATHEHTGLAPILLCFFHLLHPEIWFCLHFYLLWLSLSLPHHLPLLSQVRLPGFPCSFPLAAGTLGLAGTAGLQSSHSPCGCFPCSFIFEVDGAEAVPSYSSHEFFSPETAPPAFLLFPVSSLQLWELAQSAAGWKQGSGSPWVGRWEGGSGALLQVRQAAGPGSSGGANCSSPDLFFGISTPQRTCSGFARDFASTCFGPGISTLCVQLGCSISEGHHGPLW